MAAETGIVCGLTPVLKRRGFPTQDALLQVLVTPIIVWLVRQLLDKLGYQLSLKLTAFFAAIILFSLSAFYEIIELWDEVYLCFAECAEVSRRKSFFQQTISMHPADTLR